MATFKLSTLDRAAPRSYHRYALSFACIKNKTAVTIEKLQKAVKRVVNEIPMLAGNVSTNDQYRLVVNVTLQQIEGFSAAIARIEDSSESYATICGDGIPPRHIAGENLTPLDDEPDVEGSPACAFQGNFIDGGLILVIYLHHGIADIRGVSTILRLMSEGMPLRTLDQEALDTEAKAVSLARARLSDGAGAPAFLALARDIQQSQQQSRQHSKPTETAIEACTDVALRSVRLNDKAAVFSFKLDVILQTAEMINSRRSLRAGMTDFPAAEQVTPRDVLIAIVWGAFGRASWLTTERGEEEETSISFPVDLRSYLVPPLETHWMGNAETTAVARQSSLQLAMRYDVSTFEQSATIIHSRAKAAASDLLVRSRINLMNANPDSQDLSITDLVIHDWTPMPKMQGQEMDLGLGLGRPNAIRRIGRAVGTRKIVILPENEMNGAWEVQVELQDNMIGAMLNDELLRPFLWHVAH